MACTSGGFIVVERAEDFYGVQMEEATGKTTTRCVCNRRRGDFSLNRLSFGKGGVRPAHLDEFLLLLVK